MQTFLMLNEVVYTARTLPEGFSIGASQIVAELGYV
jgi:hypothetical protein